MNGSGAADGDDDGDDNDGGDNDGDGGSDNGDDDDDLSHTRGMTQVRQLIWARPDEDQENYDDDDEYLIGIVKILLI